MTISIFSTQTVIVFSAGILALIFAIFFFEKQKLKLSLGLLFLGALALGIFVALLDPFLNTFDELFHALVAKNMMAHPTVPVLYSKPLLDYDFKQWASNHIWLHKQPLFLWQMALSMKIFGINELAVRLPSAIMHALIPLFIFRIGKISINAKTGFYGALFFAVAYYPLELVSGHFATDHNDVAFMFYVSASFWSWFEYSVSQKKYWLVFIGVFSGCAVLVKWLMGLLVFVIWAFSMLNAPKKLLKYKTYLPIIFAFFVAVLVFLPWQLYILHVFPIESRYELAYNGQHFFVPVEGHGGDFWFHFNATTLLYGESTLVIIALALLTLIFRIKNIQYKIFIPSAIVFVYIFYSIAKTKMSSFTIIAAPLIFLGVSSLFIIITDFLKTKIKLVFITEIIKYSLLIIVCYFSFRVEEIEKNHNFLLPENGCYLQKVNERKFINNIGNSIPNSGYVIFNSQIADSGQISFMFYTDNIAYHGIPTEQQIRDVKEKGYKVAILDFGNLPDYIVADSEIIKLNPNS